MKKLLLLTALAIALFSCKKEECKNCKYIGLSFHENGGKTSNDSAWLIRYDTLYSEKCGDEAQEKRYETYIEERWVKYFTATDTIDTLYRFVHDGTWYCP